jgi:hypothetical protein
MCVLGGTLGGTRKDNQNFEVRVSALEAFELQASGSCRQEDLFSPQVKCRTKESLKFGIRRCSNGYRPILEREDLMIAWWPHKIEPERQWGFT